MTLAVWNGTAADESSGNLNVLVSPTVTVTDKATGAKPSLFSDRAGNTGIGNPFTANADGSIEFYVAPGRYKIEADDGAGNTATWDDQLIGIGGTEAVTRNVASLTDMQALSAGEYATVYMRGRSSVGDGGEGHFRWDSSNLSTEVGNDEVTTKEGDGGIYVAPSSDKTGASGAWVRQFNQQVHVAWWGAVADGTDQGTALKAAHDWVVSQETSITPSITGETGTTVGSGVQLVYGQGHYKTSVELPVGTYPNIVSEGQTMLEATTESLKIFKSDTVYLGDISGIKFIGGKHHLYLRNANTGGATLNVPGCDFHLSTDYSIYTERSDGSDLQLSMKVKVSGGKLWRCNGAVHNVCDSLTFENMHVQQREDNFDDDRAMFKNQIGKLFIHDNLFVPDRSTKTKTRWIDNHYWLDVQGNRFGGESGGIELLYNYADTDGFVRIKNNEISLSSDRHPVTFFDIPLVNIIRDNEGFIGSGGVLFDSTIPAASRRDWDQKLFIIDENDNLWKDPVVEGSAPLSGQTADQDVGKQWLALRNFQRSSEFLEDSDFVESLPSNHSGDGRVPSSSDVTTDTTNTTPFDEPTRRGTATADDGFFRVLWTSLMNGKSAGLYTAVFEVRVVSDSVLRCRTYAAEQVDVTNLGQGWHIISMPFWFDGGTYSFSEQVGYSFFNMPDTTVAELGRVTVLNGVHDVRSPNLIMYGGSAPGSGGRYVQGDVVYDTSPSASGTRGSICVTSGSPGTWKTFGDIAA